MTQMNNNSGKAWVLLRDRGLCDRVLNLAPGDGFVAAGLPASIADAWGPRGCFGLVVDAGSVRDEQPRFLQWLSEPARASPVLLLAGLQDISLAATAIEAGADFYLRLPVADAELSATLGKLRQLAEQRRRRAQALGETLYLESPQMRALYARIHNIAPLESLNVLLGGETGTGKQEAARLVHHYSKRRDGPFAEVDCAALPASLVESELFGHEAGAYTDARSRQSGLLESAQKGTLFLDEVGELPLEAQSKLLRALELRRFRRVGGREEVQLDVRLVCASNRDLGEEVRQGRFRADLYYRLNGVGLQLAPLRERLDDLETLAGYFYAQACRLFERQAWPLSAGLIQGLRAHPWPGNIRELKSMMHRLVALAPPGAAPKAELLAAELQAPGPSTAPPELLAAPDRVPSLREAEEKLARQALRVSGGNKTAAARMIGVSKPTFFRMLKQYGIKD